MKAKKWLVLAIGAMLVMNVSARDFKKGQACKGKECQMEQRMVRCERCGKVIELRKDARFRKFHKAAFLKGDSRKETFKRHHRYHGRR